MITLRLKDGTELEVTPSSNETEIVVFMEKADDFDSLKEQITTENMNGATLGGATLTDIKVISSAAYTGDDDVHTAHFSLAHNSIQDKVDAAIKQNSTDITDVQVALADIYESIAAASITA